MRKVLLAATALLVTIASAGLLVAQLPPDSVSVVVQGREAEGLSRVVAAGAAGVLGLVVLAGMGLRLGCPRGASDEAGRPRG